MPPKPNGSAREKAPSGGIWRGEKDDLSGLLDALSGPVVMVSKAEVILFANKAAREVLAGVKDGDITGVNLQNFLSPETELNTDVKLHEDGDENVIKDRRNVVWGVRKQIAEFAGQEGFLYQFRRVSFREQCLDTIRNAHPNPIVFVKLPENEEGVLQTDLNEAAKEYFPDFESAHLPAIMAMVETMQQNGDHLHKHTLREEGKEGFRYTDLGLVYMPDQGHVMVYGSDVTDFMEMAEYPKYNPNPILRFGISTGGISIIYCNPAALKEFPFLVHRADYKPLSSEPPKKSISLHRMDRQPAEIFENLPEIIDRLKSDNRRAFFTREINIQPPEGGEKCYEQKVAWDPGNPNVGITFLSDITARKKLIAELENLSGMLKEETIRDPLTGLFNRRYLERIMQTRVHEAMRHGDSFGLLIADIDHFKRFNDDYSHPAGDAVLKVVADTIAKTLRTHDIVCRYGGEEFVAVLPRTQLNGIEEAAERLRKTIESLPRVVFNNKELPGITISVGGVSIGLEGDPTQINLEKQVESLIWIADKELQRAKRGGRNTIRVRMISQYRFRILPE